MSLISSVTEFYFLNTIDLRRSIHLNDFWKTKMGYSWASSSVAKQMWMCKVSQVRGDWWGELAACNCIKLAVTRPRINHFLNSSRTTELNARIPLLFVGHLHHKLIEFYTKKITSSRNRKRILFQELLFWMLIGRLYYLIFKIQQSQQFLFLMDYKWIIAD